MENDSPSSPDKTQKHFWKILLLIVSLAATVRVGAILLWQPVISRDGVEYLRAARLYAQGQYKQALKHYYPPGYPALVALGYGKHLELWARLVNILAQLALIILIAYSLRPEGPQIALQTSLLIAIFPYGIRYSIRVLSDSLFASLLLGSWALLYQAWQSKKKSLYLAIGSMTCYGYLVRPEGILALLFFSAWTLIQEKKPWTCLLYLWIPSLLLVLPYLMWIKQNQGLYGAQPGSWKLTLKRNILQTTTAKTFLQSPNLQNFLNFLKKTAYNLYKNTLYLVEMCYLPLFLLGTLGLLSTPSPRRKYLLALLLFLCLFQGMFALFRADKRLTFQLAMLWILPMPWGIKRIWPTVRKHLPHPSLAWPLLLAITLPVGLRPLGTDKQYLKQGGEYLLQIAGKSNLIGPDARLGYYAQAKTFQILSIYSPTHFALHSPTQGLYLQKLNMNKQAQLFYSSLHSFLQKSKITWIFLPTQYLPPQKPQTWLKKQGFQLQKIFWNPQKTRGVFLLKLLRGNPF